MFRALQKASECVYLATADQSEVCLLRPTDYEVLTALKTQLLIAPRVHLASSHVFESSLLRGALQRCPWLLASGAVVLELREGCRDFEDQLEAWVQDPRKVHPYYRSPAARNFAKFLGETGGVARYYTVSSQQEMPRASLVEELDNVRSDLRKRLTGVSRQSIDELRGRIADISVVSRESLRGPFSPWTAREVSQRSPGVSHKMVVSRARGQLAEPPISRGP